jgi:hypothetical protein
MIYFTIKGNNNTTSSTSNKTNKAKSPIQNP